MRYLISAIGVGLAVGFICVSAVMNWRYGQALGRDPTDRLLYAAANIMGDAFKAVAPFFMWWAMKERRLAVACVAACLWVLCTLHSLGSLLGYVQLNREASAGTTSTKREIAADLRSELSRKQEQLRALRSYDASDAIEKRIAALRLDLRWAASRGCERPRASADLPFCSQIKTLEAQLAQAQERVRLERDIEQLRQALLSSGHVAKVHMSGDAQAAAIAELVGWDVPSVQTGLSILLVCLIELGSSFGLFAAINHGALGRRSGPSDVTRPVAPGPAVSGSNAPSRGQTRGEKEEGEIERFAEQCLVAAAGSTLSLDSIYGAYRDWCGRQDRRPEHDDTFAQRFGSLAKLVGIARTGQGRRMVFKNVGLAEKN